MAAGAKLDDRLHDTIVEQIRTRLSPRHVPDVIVEAPAIPRTLTGKKLEVPVKRLLQGEPLEELAAPGAVENLAALEWYARYAAGSPTAART
jgi:acetoacetyl-CoA synthetase